LVFHDHALDNVAELTEVMTQRLCEHRQSISNITNTFIHQSADISRLLLVAAIGQRESKMFRKVM